MTATGQMRPRLSVGATSSRFSLSKRPSATRVSPNQRLAAREGFCSGTTFPAVCSFVIALLLRSPTHATCEHHTTRKRACQQRIGGLRRATGERRCDAGSRAHREAVFLLLPPRGRRMKLLRSSPPSSRGRIRRRGSGEEEMQALRPLGWERTRQLARTRVEESVLCLLTSAEGGREVPQGGVSLGRGPVFALATHEAIGASRPFLAAQPAD